jgi:hypothetical protein
MPRYDREEDQGQEMKKVNEMARPKQWIASRPGERPPRAPALWAALVGCLALASCGGGGSSPDEVRSCLTNAGLEAEPLAVGQTERDDYGVTDEIRINLGNGRGATVYFFDSNDDASSLAELPAPGISEQYGDTSFYVGPGIAEEDVDAIRSCLDDGD